MQSKPGQFDKSFEKVIDKIEHSSPRMKLINEMSPGCGVKEHDQWFADLTPAELKKQAEQDLRGKEAPSVADNRRTIMFDGDWSDRIKETLQKAEKVRANQGKVDPKILKTTKESGEYYYPQQTLEEKQWRRRAAAVVATCVVLAMISWLRRTLSAARTD